MATGGCMEAVITNHMPYSIHPYNDAYYCSEFIEVAFGGLFPSKPINWRDADGNLPEYWQKHFEKLGVPVP